MKKLLSIIFFAFVGLASFAKASDPIFPKNSRFFVGANVLTITTKDAMDKLLANSLKDPVEAEKINQLLERIKAAGLPDVWCVGQWNDQMDMCTIKKPTKSSLCSLDSPKEFKFTFVCTYYFAYNCTTQALLFWVSYNC